MKNHRKKAILLVLLPFSIAFCMEPPEKKEEFEQFRESQQAFEDIGPENYLDLPPTELTHELLRFRAYSIDTQQKFKDAIHLASRTGNFEPLEELAYFKLIPNHINKPIDSYLTLEYLLQILQHSRHLWSRLIKAFEIVVKSVPNLNAKDQYGHTILYWLFFYKDSLCFAQSEFLEILNILLKYGANPNIVVNGRTALDAFIYYNLSSDQFFNATIINLLRKYGAKTTKELLQELFKRHNLPSETYLDSLPVELMMELVKYYQSEE